MLSAASVSGHAAWQRWGAQGIICAGAAQALALARSGGSCGSRVAEGVRAVGSVHRGKIVGNVVEAWERRNVEELQGTRDPANFDDFSVGDSVAVRFVNVWNTQKLATFAGICVARRGGLIAASFTLRNHVDGFAVEQQFALNSPLIRGIRKIKEPTKRKKRAKLYFLRERAPKESTVVVNEKELNLPTVP